MAPKRVYVIMTEGDAIRGSEIWCQSFPFRRTDWQRENAIIEDQFEMTSGRFEDLTNHLKSQYTPIGDKLYTAFHICLAYESGYDLDQFRKRASFCVDQKNTLTQFLRRRSFCVDQKTH